MTIRCFGSEPAGGAREHGRLGPIDQLWLPTSRVIDAPENDKIRSLMRLPFFYGWIIVVVTFVTMAIGVNARTAFSLFFPPVIEEFGWGGGVTAGGGSCRLFF